ncbi:MAG: hypothetical protein LBN30_05025 [Oscillospiraceae bacterium]|jgi:hypothetical protein|nr:hypothetical protein [Oscillospiraceae bacterium]
MIKRRKALYSILPNTLLLLVLYMFQGLLLPYIPRLAAIPLLLPLAVVGAGVFGGSVRGGIVGIAAGMLCDVSFHQPVASATLVLAVVGLVIGFLSDTVMARGFPTYFVCCALTLVVMAFVQMFPLLFFDGVELRPLLQTAFLQTYTSLIFTIPVYFAARAVTRREVRS